MRKPTSKDLKAIDCALSHGAIRKIKAFLSQGWNPQEAIAGRNPLSRVQHVDIADLIIEKGADLDEAFGFLPPLITQVLQRNSRMVALLLKAGAYVDIQTKKTGDQLPPLGSTALMGSIEENCTEIFKMLLKHKANINLKDRRDKNALYYACHWNRTEMAKALLRRGSALTCDVLGGPVYFGNANLVKSLIARGADLDCSFDHRFPGDMPSSPKTPLGYAIGQTGIAGYPKEIVTMLVRAGADVNKPSPWWRINRRGNKICGTVAPTPPIRIAGSRGLKDVMDLLWKAGAKGTIEEAMADCSLERAAYRNEPVVLKLLIKAGRDVNAIGEETGKRPIELAHEKGNKEIVGILRRAGAREIEIDD